MLFEPKVITTSDFILHGDNVSVYHKEYEKVASHYLNPRTDNPIVYDVYTMHNGNGNFGCLNWGLTILHSIDSNGECNMTAGHFHANKSCSEIYVCVDGEGILLCMDEAGITTAEKMVAGSVHYISGKLAHRVVNTGNKDLKFYGCWDDQAGHDYHTIEKHPFGIHVFKIDNTIVLKES